MEEKSSRKEFEFRCRGEKDDIERRLNSQLSTDRSNYQNEIHHISRQSKLLAKNLNLARREVDSLRIQVRRLQAENAGYKRSLTNRPHPSGAPTKSHASLPKNCTPSVVNSRSRLDARKREERESFKAKGSNACGGHPDRSISPKYRRPVKCSNDYQGALDIHVFDTTTYFNHGPH